MYRFHNANSLGNFTNDCVLRAVSLAEGKTWDETYEELSYIAQRNGILLDDVKFVEPLLDSRYERVCADNMTVGELSAEYPNDILLITMNGHITCSMYGTIYDTFDCRNRLAKCCWFVE